MILKAIVRKGGIVFLSCSVASMVVATIAEAGKFADCEKVIAEAQSFDRTPQVTVDEYWGIVRYQGKTNFCREPIEIWKARNLGWSVTYTQKSERPKYFGSSIDPSQKPPLRLKSNEQNDAGPSLRAKLAPADAIPANAPKIEPNTELTATSQVISQVRADNPVSTTSACDVKIEEQWTAGYHKYDGKDYLLRKIESVDGNNDGIVDNLVFTLVADNHEQLILRHFEPSDGPRQQNIGTLAIPENLNINRFCLDSISFGIPIRTEPPLTISPGLHGEVARNMMIGAIETQDRDMNAKEPWPREEDVDIFWVLAFSLLLTISGLLVLILVNARAPLPIPDQVD